MPGTEWLQILFRTVLRGFLGHGKVRFVGIRKFGEERFGHAL